MPTPATPRKFAGIHHKRGFTLIELLIVIEIIGILTAILFPVFARARANARRATCQSNLKQIGLGIMQYTQDYDEKFPLWFMDGDGVTVGYLQATSIGAGGPGKDQGWSELIQPYIKSTQLLQCPDEPTNPIPAGGNYNGYVDYMSNLCAINVQAGMVGLIAPAQTVLVSDSRTYDSSNSYYCTSGWTPPPGHRAGGPISSASARK